MRADSCLQRRVVTLAYHPWAGAGGCPLSMGSRLLIPGARDPAAETALAAALEKGGWNKVTRFVRSATVPDERCWLRGPGWCLAHDRRIH